MRLPKLLQPIKDQTLRVARQLQRKPAPTPTLAEFVSPLRETLKQELAVKPDIGYEAHCAACRAHQTVDQRIATAVAEYEDPQPWLVELHGDLIKTREELIVTRQALADERREAEQWKNPLRRAQWIAAGGTVGIVFLVIKEVFQAYLLPLILTSIP